MYAPAYACIYLLWCAFRPVHPHEQVQFRRAFQVAAFKQLLLFLAEAHHVLRWFMATHTGSHQYKWGHHLGMDKREIERNFTAERYTNNVRLLNVEEFQQRCRIFEVCEEASRELRLAVPAQIIAYDLIPPGKSVKLLIPHAAVRYTSVDQKQGMTLARNFIV